MKLDGKVRRDGETYLVSEVVDEEDLSMIPINNDAFL